MIEVAVTIEVEDATSTDQAERYVRLCIDSKPGLRVKCVAWTTHAAALRPRWVVWAYRLLAAPATVFFAAPAAYWAATGAPWAATQNAVAVALLVCGFWVVR